MPINILTRWFETLPSTNDVCSELAAAGAPEGLVVAAHRQTAGRGQRGNKWQSTPGQSLTFSLLLRPAWLGVREQFALSEAVALGLADWLRPQLAAHHAVRLKWPNDLYVDDRKLAGVLIETAYSGPQLGQAVVGIGINLNQRAFPPELPNPVALTQLTVQEHEPESTLQQVLGCLARRYEQLARSGRTAIDADYAQALYRRGLPTWFEADGRRFQAIIEGVSPLGELLLREGKKTPRRYTFNQVHQVVVIAAG